MNRSRLFLLLFFLAACAPVMTTAPTAIPPVVSVSASPAVEPWLSEVYACAGEFSAVVRRAASPSASDIHLRLGEPEMLATPAYPIGSEELLVVAHHSSPIRSLTADEARGLFSEGQEQVELWVFASGDEAQVIFEREVMGGARIHPLAGLALHPQQMLNTLNAHSNAVGLLPGRWNQENLRAIFSLTGISVLAITPGEPEGVVKEIIGCLQK